MFTLINGRQTPGPFSARLRVMGLASGCPAQEKCPSAGGLFAGENATDFTPRDDWSLRARCS